MYKRIRATKLIGQKNIKKGTATVHKQIICVISMLINTKAGNNDTNMTFMETREDGSTKNILILKKMFVENGTKVLKLERFYVIFLS